MSLFESLELLDFDHLEFAVDNLEEAEKLYYRLGFEKIGTRQLHERGVTSSLLAQNEIFIVLSHSTQEGEPVSEYVKKHGNGVISVGIQCRNALSTLEKVVSRGAKAADTPKTFENELGSVQQCSIQVFGDVRFSFISRTGNLFAEGFTAPRRTNHSGTGLFRIDHITNNVEKNQREHWKGFFEKVFGFEDVRYFDIKTQRTGLYSTVMQSPNGVLKMPFNEPVGEGSQIQEFIDVHHGAGVQHVALETKSIIPTLRTLRQNQLKFLSVPTTYYEAIPSRVPNVTENLNELEELGILVDGDKAGYLLQLFTENVVGPFFYEVIQRKGNNGFGEGNFTALFEAIERDQIRRGVLK